MTESIPPLAELSLENILKVARRTIDQANSIEPGALGVILRGSRVRGTNRSDSDLDITTVVSNNSQSAERIIIDLLTQATIRSGLLIDTGPAGSLNFAKAQSELIAQFGRYRHTECIIVACNPLVASAIQAIFPNSKAHTP